MINKISIRNAAAYGSCQQELDSLKKINFIYGSNGTGKTTISRIINDPNPFGECEVRWENDEVLETLVYSRDFIQENFDQPDELEGIFTLGKADKEVVRKIKSAREESIRITGRITALTTALNGDDTSIGKVGELRALDVDFTNTCWKLKRRFDNRFQDAFAGHRHSKISFRDKLLQESRTNRSPSVSLEELESKAATLFGPAPMREEPVNLPDIDRLVSHAANSILSKKVVGKSDVDIAALIDTLNNSDWVKQGRQYYDRNERVCPFCQQRTTESLEKSLNDYFDDSFQADSEKIERLYHDYKSDSEKLIRLLGEIRQNPPARLDEEAFGNRCDLLNSKIDLNLKRIEQKRQHSSTPIELVPLMETFAPTKGLLDGVNNDIQKHNKMVENFAAEKSRLTRQVWRFLLDHEIKTELTQYIGRRKGLRTGIDTLRTKIKNRIAEKQKKEKYIRDLEKTTTSIQPTIDGINTILKSFGFKGFSLAQSDHDKFYTIQRPDGSAAKETLSEGERSFIAFLYFYHLLQGSTSASGVTTDRVIVFDDPVSSLDSQVLFVVSSLIREFIEEVRTGTSTSQQIFIFTHNVYFHREVSYDSKRSHDGTARRDETFWVVKKPRNHSIVTQSLKNPITTTYELLWREVREANECDWNGASIANTLRRILEYYFTILGNVDRNKICSHFEGQNQIACRSLFSWVNAGSHSIFEEIDFSDESTRERYLEIFKKIFEETGHISHYKMMMNNG